MARFNVLVVGTECYNETCEVLKPFDEHEEYPLYIKFTREDIAKKRKKLLKYWQKLHDSLPDDLGIVSNLRALCKNDEEYFKAQTSFYTERLLNDDGEPVTTYNPNTKFSHWDYCNGILPNRGSCTFAARKKDIDWAKIKMCNSAAAARNWSKIASSQLSDTKKLLVYDFWPDENKKQYLDRKKLFMTHAYVLHGKWYERCSIDWWNHVNDLMDRDIWIEQYMTMLQQVKPDTVLTTIECNF